MLPSPVLSPGGTNVQGFRDGGSSMQQPLTPTYGASGAGNTGNNGSLSPFLNVYQQMRQNANQRTSPFGHTARNMFQF